MNQQTCFDATQLKEFLDERLNEQDEIKVVEHIDQCPSCQKGLELVAADRNDWSDLRNHLADHVESDLVKETLLFGHDQEQELDRDLEMERLQQYLGPTDNPEMLGRLGSYEVCGLVGRGSTGVVVKAFDSRLNRYVAIKVLAPSFASNGPARTRFEREAKSVAAVSHEHVVPIHAVDEYRGLPYIVMKYIPGGSLHQRIERKGPLDNCEAVRLGMQIASGLAAAHAQGIVHRDVKPANVMLEQSVDRAMVTDFGLARVADDAAMTRSGVIAGTPQYMSPEQAMGEAIDPRSDLFSLGSVMYTACTGRPPFRSETVFGVIKRVCDTSPRPIREINPKIEPWLARFIEKLHAKNREDRFESATQVAHILGQELAYLQSPSFASTPERPWIGKPVQPSAPLKTTSTASTSRLLNLFAIAASLVAIGLSMWSLVPGFFAPGADANANWIRPPAKHANGSMIGESVVSDNWSSEPSPLENDECVEDEQSSLAAASSAPCPLENDESVRVRVIESEQTFISVNEVEVEPELETDSGSKPDVAPKFAIFKHKEQRRYTPTKPGTLVINANSEVVKVKTDEDIEEIRLDIIRRIKARSRKESKAFLKGHKVIVTQDGDLLNVDAKMQPLITDCETDEPFELVEMVFVIPQKYNVDIKTVGSNIHLEELNGEAILESKEGSIFADPVAVKLVARTQDGGVFTSIGGGTVDVDTEHGAVQAKIMSELDGDVHFHSTHGQIEIAIPKDSNYRVDATSTSGQVTSPDGSETNGSDVKTSFGNTSADGKTIEVSSDDGAINVVYLEDEDTSKECSESGCSESGCSECSCESDEANEHAVIDGETGLPGKTVAIEKAFTGDVIDGYTIYLPESHEVSESDYPVIMYLSGGCAVGGKVGQLCCYTGIPKMLIHRNNVNEDVLDRLADEFVIVAPHMKAGSFDERQFYNEGAAIKEIVDEVVATYKADKSRLYLVGMGRGGHGTWGLASRMPEMFAAISPVRSESHGVTEYEGLAKLPIWTGHNVEDDECEYKETAKMVLNCEKLTGKKFAKLTSEEIPDGFVDSNRQIFTSEEGCGMPGIYNRPEFYTWLLRFRIDD